MRSEKIFDLVVWLFIASVGLVAAYVCFGILNSQASGRYQQYSVGGAIAGALISWSVLTSVYLQLRGSSNELQDLRRETVHGDEIHRLDPAQIFFCLVALGRLDVDHREVMIHLGR